MPPSVSVKSLELLKQRAQLDEGALASATRPVWVDTRFVRGYFEAAPLRELCNEREDLGYITKTVRNADRGDIPGFSFVREGGETLNDFFKQLTTASDRPSPETASPPTE